MQTDRLILKVLGNTYTQLDVTRRVRLLREYLEKMFFSAEEPDLTKFLLTRMATTEDIDAFLSWGEDFYQAFTHENAYRILKEITDQSKKAPVVILYIPYDAVPAEVTKLGKWFRSHIHDALLIDLHTDPSLLGGCAFVWKGVYRDYSLRYYMLKRRDDIHKLISEYVAKFYNPV